MQVKKFSAIFLICLFSLSSCFWNDNPSKLTGLKRAYPDRSDKDVKVPKVLVEALQKRYLWHTRELKPSSELTDVQILSDISRKYLGLHVYLVPVRNKLALPDPLHFFYPRGGGVINLKSHILGKKGSFNLIMKVNTEGTDVETSDFKDLKVYFVSNSRRRKIGGKTFGSGCNKLMEITDFFKSELSKGGVKLNATDARHVSLVSGTFYFALYKAGSLYLASSSFEDSRWPDYQCVV